MSAIKINSMNDLVKVFGEKNGDVIMPSLFLGHGSPMNAIADNTFTRTLSAMGKRMPRPEAILCISAHWMTNGTWITQMENPKTIHDFYGFPQPLYDIQYPAPGRPDIASAILKEVTEPLIQADKTEWGLDHGTWAVLRHMYPDADVPVIQLSLDMSKPLEFHMQLGKELAKLRKRGIMIVASGNIVHNLRSIRWEPNATPFDWALEFDEWTKEKLLKRDFKALASDFMKTEAGRLAVPTIDHYLPLLYTIGSADHIDELKFEYEEIQNGSISMRGLSFGKVGI